MRQKIYIYILLCMSLLMGASCSSDKKAGKKEVTAKVQSAPYELLVVANKDWLKTEAGQSLVQTVEAPIEGLPQGEPNFRVTYINPFAFDGVFKTYANIVKVEVEKKYAEAKMVVQHNVYARPQIVVYLYAPDASTFVSYMAAHGNEVLALLNKNEFVRERSFLQKHYSGTLMRAAQQQFGVSLNAPKDVDDLKRGKNFLWASASKQEFRQNVCLYTIPLQDLTLERLVDVRDSVMKVNIPGGREDQWMETDRRTVSCSVVMEKGQKLFVVRGLWDMKNDAMGGPFVCYVYPDEAHERLLVAEGFVFAPEEKKRPIVRQLEAALQTVVWTEKRCR